MREFTDLVEFDKYTEERAAANRRDEEYRRARAKLIAERLEKANAALEAAARYDHAAYVNRRDPIGMLEWIETFETLGSARFNAGLDMWNASDNGRFIL